MNDAEANGTEVAGAANFFSVDPRLRSWNFLLHSGLQQTYHLLTKNLPVGFDRQFELKNSFSIEGLFLF